MNIKSFFVNDEGRLSLLKRYSLPSSQIQTPTVYEHGASEVLTNVPMASADLLQCIENGLTICQAFPNDVNLFETSFNVYFPNLECYWDAGKVNMFKNMVVHQPMDMGMKRSVARQIYTNFVDDHYHTVARNLRSPQIDIHNKYLIQSLSEPDIVPFEAQRVELVLPMIGVGTYFNKVPAGLSLVTITVPNSNSLPLDVLTKRVQYCNALPQGCRVEVDTI